MRTYPTLNVAVFDLRRRGYRLSFFRIADLVVCGPAELSIPFEDLQIDERYTFPSAHNPEMISIVYAVSTSDGVRGLVLDCAAGQGCAEKIIVAG